MQTDGSVGIGAPVNLGFTRRINTIASKENDTTKFLTAAAHALRTNCNTCGGKGHAMETCSSRIALDAAAKEMGISWEWGAAKGAAYYQEWVTNPANARAVERNKQSALRKQISKAKLGTLRFKKKSR